MDNGVNDINNIDYENQTAENPENQNQAAEEKRTVADFIKGADKVGELLKNTERIESVLQQVLSRLKEIDFTSMKELSDLMSADSINLMILLVSDWMKGRYREVPINILLAVSGALLYFATPNDSVPEFISKPGHIDDKFVAAVVLRQIYETLQEYRKWRESESLAEQFSQYMEEG